MCELAKGPSTFASRWLVYAARRLHVASKNFQENLTLAALLHDAPAGASGCFRAHLYHASVEPASTDEHLKIAFFFRKSTRGERRAKRALAEGHESAAELELAQRRKMAAAQQLM